MNAGVCMRACAPGFRIRFDICTLCSTLTFWLTPQAASPPKHFWDVWKLFDFPHMFSSTNGGGVLWSAMPRQLPTVLALAFVVAFGSSLDVAAIQQDNPEELDYNKELVTVVSLYLSSLSVLLKQMHCPKPVDRGKLEEYNSMIYACLFRSCLFTDSISGSHSHKYVSF